MFVTVTNYGGTAELAAWVNMWASIHEAVNKPGHKYPVHWRENRQRTYGYVDTNRRHFTSCT